MNRNYYLMNLWRWKCGLPEKGKEQAEKMRYEDVKKSELSDEFEQLMRNRLAVGAYRYGLIGAPNKPKFNHVKSMIKRLQEFDRTGNKEFLVDVANLCLVEFAECHHPNEHFNSIDDGEHVQETP